LTFAAGHRVYGHEGHCRFPHGHNYVATITASAEELDELGRVVDFGVVKTLIGGWIEQNWDHAFIFWHRDRDLIAIYEEHRDWKHYQLALNPTAENLANHLHRIADGLLENYHITVTKVRIEETENCAAESVLRQ
jgi:6-pyruvoyltetrahydropterin/6-carboxytetrahydropterin synthase